MRDRLAELLDHYADALTAGSHPMTAAPTMAPARRRGRRRVGPVLLPAAAAVAVVAIAAAAFLTPKHAALTPQYSTRGPELGTITVPVTWGRADQTRRGVQPGQAADVLAKGTNREGTVVVVGQRRPDGELCYLVGYLPPATNRSSAGGCPASGANLFGTNDIGAAGQGPGGAPGGIKDPPLAYGQAPPGTRSVVLTSRVLSTTVAARDAGPAYGHRAFFVATWDLGTKTTLRAIDGRGRTITTRDFPYRPSTPNDNVRQCAAVRGALRGHFQRAIALGTIWARNHPSSRDSNRLSPRIQDASTDAGASTLLRTATRDVKIMGQQERYEYKLAANVITGETVCFTSPALRSVALQYLAASRG